MACERLGRPANTPAPSWWICDVLPCISSRRAHDVAAEGLGDRLVAEADAEDRDLAAERAIIDEMPALVGCPGPGEMTMPFRLQLAASTVIASLRSRHLGAELAEVLDRL